MVDQVSSGAHTQEELSPGTHRPKLDPCMHGEVFMPTGQIRQSNLRQSAAADYKGKGENCAFLGYYAASSNTVTFTTTLPLPPSTCTKPAGCQDAT
jgi:hypothetical protein